MASDGTGMLPHMSSRHPLGWVLPERLPPDLPSQEVWVRSMPFKLAGTPSLHPPTTAPGFDRARRLGLLPPEAPLEQPVALPGINSVQAVLLLPVLALSYFGLVSRVVDDLGWWILLPTAAIIAGDARPGSLDPALRVLSLALLPGAPPGVGRSRLGVPE